MKIEKISENKIRITITLSDLKARNLDLRSLSYNSPQAQEFFWELMRKAEIEYGFSAKNAQLFVEAVQGSSESLIITITRVEDDLDFESIHKYIKNRYRKSELKVKKKTKKVSCGILIYSFRDFEDLCSVAKLLGEIYLGDSTLYKYNDLFYLVLTKNSIASTNSEYFEAIISEYGEKVINTGFIEGFLNEYGTLMIENNALEILKDYFN